MTSKTRTSRWQPIVFLLGILALVSIVTLLFAPPARNAIPLHPNNVQDDGTAALVNILRQQGVQVQVADSLPQVEAAATRETTVVLLNVAPLDDDQRDRIRQLPATVVMGFGSLDDVGELSRSVETYPQAPPDYVTAQCDDPDAQAAARISGTWASMRKQPNAEDVTICFPVPERSDLGAFAAWKENGAQRYALADTDLFTNAELANDGNAALTLRLLGKHETLIWFTALDADSTLAITYAPTWYRAFIWLGCVLLVAMIWWRAPRFGPVATEQLPVVVKGGEIVRGVGRLYYHHRTVEHAATALRTGTLTRLRKQLGLGAQTNETATIAAIAAQVNRSESSLHLLLAGPAPASAAQLTDLANELATLEREVHLL